MSPLEPETVETARRRILDYTNDRWEFLEPRLDEFEAAVRRDERERARELIETYEELVNAPLASIARLQAERRLAEYRAVSASGGAE